MSRCASTSGRCGCSIPLAFELLSLLMGREYGATIHEIREALGVHIRTAYRYAEQAEASGVAEWIRARRPYIQPSRLRLVNYRMRRVA